MDEYFLKKLLNVAQVSQMTFDDEPTFRIYIKKEKEVVYSNSWLYTLRSARNGNGELGLKYFDNDLLFSISSRHDAIYVGKVFGLNKDNIEKFESIVASIYLQLEKPIIIKKFPVEFIKLLPHTSPLSKIVSAEERIFLEDDAYSEKDINLNKLLENSTGNVRIIPKRFRMGVNRFINQKINIVENHLSLAEKNIDIQLSYLKEVARDNNEKYQSYKIMIKYLFNKNNLDSKYIVKLYRSGESVEGYYMLETLNENTVGFYCGLTSTRWGGLTEYLDFLTFKDLYDKGIRYVLLGGSETMGVANYVNKLLPDNPSYSVITLIYNPLG